MIWFDNAATSHPKPEAVYQARDKYFREGIVSEGRGIYSSAQLAQRVFTETRRTINMLFNGYGSEYIFFTSGATEALNIVIQNTKNNDHIISTMAHHNAVRRTLFAMKSKNISHTICAPLTYDNFRTLLKNAIQPNTTLLILNHCSNVNGSVQPIDEIAFWTKKHHPHIKILVDAAQSAGHLEVLQKAWYIDYVAITAHKGLFGSAGLGALLTNPADLIKPIIYGGTGHHSVSTDMISKPNMFEAGTRDGASIGAWNEGLKFILEQGLSVIQEHENMLKKYFLENLALLPKFAVYSNNDRVPVISLTHCEMSSEEIASVLAEEKIAVRAGFHCAPDMHEFLGTKKNGTVRFSFNIFNNTTEIDTALQILKNL